MRVLLAFDKFKDAISAYAACTAAADALRELHPTWEFDLCPLTDGGEGFTEILTRGASGRMQVAEVTGPRGERVSASFGRVQLKNIPRAAQDRLALPPDVTPDSAVAIIEMAAASGLALLPADQRDPWLTSTKGTGELMRMAAACDAKAIILGLGGSATNDLGLGALAALGINFLDASRKPIDPPTPAEWPRITDLSGAIPDTFPPVRVACDVTNPLLGANGCSAIYGRQKGLAPADLEKMESVCERAARQLCAYFGKPSSLMETPGAGAAGGIAFGLITALDAQILSGFDMTSDWLNLTARIRLADVVITGEGRFDDSSAQGKGPGAILSLAAAHGRTAHVFAGQVTASSHPTAQLHQITPASWTRAQALQQTLVTLRSAVQLHFPPTYEP